jgi:hypothetical protein
LRSGLEGFSLLAVGSMRRLPLLHFTPMKMGTGFGVNAEKRRGQNPADKEESNVLDRAGCPIIEFVFLVYVSFSFVRSDRS